MVTEAEVVDPSFEGEAVLLTFPAGDLRMRSTGDQIQGLGMTFDDRG